MYLSIFFYVLFNLLILIYCSLILQKNRMMCGVGRIFQNKTWFILILQTIKKLLFLPNAWYNSLHRIE